MNKEKSINKALEEAMDSLDGINRAEARPFLLTRINARMNRSAESAWEKAGWFIGRPAVAISGLCLVLLINAAVVMMNRQDEPAVATEQVSQTPADEFSYTVATIYDNENIQP